MMEGLKQTGIRWIGEIPSDWNTKRIKYMANLKGRIGWQGLTSDEYQDEGAYLITGVDFLDGSINWDQCEHVPMKRWEEAKDIQIQNGDLLITKDGTVGKVAIVSNMPGETSLNSGVLRIMPVEGYSRRFLYWVLQSEVFWNWFNFKNAGNSTIVHLYQGDFAEFIYAFPKYDEQERIADYLDNKCDKLDAIITTVQQQIETLKAYKKSFITEVVTKGLDSTVEMKDSGVDWIGKIPKHWDALRLKYVMDNYDYLRKPIEASERSQDGDVLYDYYGASGIIDQINDYIVEGEKLLIGEDGANLVYRNLPLIYIADGKYWVNNHAHILHPKDNWNLHYFAHQMEIIDYTVFITGSAQPKLNQENLNNVMLVVPPADEQDAIADYLDEKCHVIDSIMQEKSRQLSTVKQHKNSLIYEYVTGKKRVKEVI